MLSHVILGVNDVPRAVEFYDAILGVLGYDRRWIGEAGAGYGTDDELGIDTFWLTKPVDDKPATVGNGTNVAFIAPSRKAVQDFYEKALARIIHEVGRAGQVRAEAAGFPRELRSEHGQRAERGGDRATKVAASERIRSPHRGVAPLSRLVDYKM